MYYVYLIYIPFLQLTDAHR